MADWTDANIRFNIKAHNAVAEKYESHHTQIFNPIEQERIRAHLKRALALLQAPEGGKENTRSVQGAAAGVQSEATGSRGASSRAPGRAIHALDFGCGSGNITRHLLDLGLTVTSADVAPAFLRLIERRFPGPGGPTTVQINGSDLANLPSGSFDLAVAYAVLHHVPDYLGIVAELIRVVKPGGLILIDREAAAGFWNPTPAYRAFTAAVAETMENRPNKLSASRFLKLSTYVNRWRLMRNPRFQPEGDIHIWPDDRIEWDRIKSIFAQKGCDVLIEEEYLSYDGKYPTAIYEAHRERCADDMWILARKN